MPTFVTPAAVGSLSPLNRPFSRNSHSNSTLSKHPHEIVSPSSFKKNYRTHGLNMTKKQLTAAKNLARYQLYPKSNGVSRKARRRSLHQI